MERTKRNSFPAHSFSQRFGSMFAVDAGRMFGTPLFWVCLGIAFAVPILVLVMTTMVGGEGGMAFTNTWQIIASDGAGMADAMGAAMGGGAAAGVGMDMTMMMNSGLVYFLLAVFLCLFTAEDFRSGYAKNLFTVHARKTDYVASKTVIGFLAGTLFLLAFFLGGVFGGAIAGLSFDLGTAGVFGLVCCMLAKIFLSLVFTALALLMCAIGKGRSWLSILLSLFVGMLLFMMVPMMTPLASGFMQVGMCLAGGVLFALGIGAGSNLILKTTSLV